MSAAPRPRRAAIVLTALLAAATADLAGQGGVVRGRVVRADGPVGLADVELVLHPSGAATRSDASGGFVFHGVAPGPAELSAVRPGYVSEIVPVQVSALGATEIEVALEPVAARLDPIVTTATRGPRSLSESAIAVSVADTFAIRRGRMDGLHGALRGIPGVQALSRYGTDDVNIGIRGSAARARQAVRGVTLLLDGIPLTEPDGVARPDLVEVAAASRIEVVRGPGSALHAGSSGGVVNVLSRTGRDSPGIALKAQGGGFGFRKVDGRAGGLFAGGRGSALIVSSYTSTDGHRTHSDAEIVRGHLSLDYLAGPHTQIAFQATGSSLDSRLPGSLSLPEMETDPRAAGPPALAFGFGRRDGRFRAGVRAETDVDAATANGYLFYGGRTLRFPIPSEIVDLDLRRVQGGARLRSGRIGGLPVRGTAGVDYDRVFGDDRRWENDGGIPGTLHDDGAFVVSGLGAYAQLEWRASSDVTTTLGLRYDRVDYEFESRTPGAIPRQEKTFSQTSPRLAAAWRPDALTSLYASVGRSFEVPAIGELSPSPGDPLRPVRPKSLWNYEVGARRTLGDRVLLEGAVFVAAVRGEFVPITVDGRSLPENASRSRNAGLELGLTALAASWLDVGASYAFLDLRLRDYVTFVSDPSGTPVETDFSGRRLPGVPRHRITGEARVRPLEGLDLGIQVEWQDVVYVETGNVEEGVWTFRSGTDGSVRQAPFRAVPAGALIHLSAAYRLGPGTLFGSVENLLGRTYAGNVIANEAAGRFYEPGPPRWLSLGFGLAGWGAAPGPAS